MCGRINVSDNEGVRVLLESLGMTIWPSREPRFNIAPMQTLDVVQYQNDETLALVPMSWGVSLKMPGKSGNMITKRIQNSRSDKVWTSRMWKKLIAEQRAEIHRGQFLRQQEHQRRARVHRADSRVIDRSQIALEWTRCPSFGCSAIPVSARVVVMVMKADRPDVGRSALSLTPYPTLVAPQRLFSSQPVAVA